DGTAGEELGASSFGSRPPSVHRLHGAAAQAEAGLVHRGRFGGLDELLDRPEPREERSRKACREPHLVNSGKVVVGDEPSEYTAAAGRWEQRGKQEHEERG
ncbi:unnamed protein product, partial [Ectocarpus sp. 12 AP-2014]